MENHPYQACYCEENIWHLTKHFPKAKIIFILNQKASTKLYYQKASLHPFFPVYWDYHVILIHKENDSEMVYDFDTYMDFPTDAQTYFSATFNVDNEPIDEACVLRVIDAEAYQHYFHSDRTHMQDEDGNWLMPPPIWQAIMNTAANCYALAAIRNLANEHIGELIPLRRYLADMRDS